MNIKRIAIAAVLLPIAAATILANPASAQPRPSRSYYPPPHHQRTHRIWVPAHWEHTWGRHWAWVPGHYVNRYW